MRLRSLLTAVVLLVVLSAVTAQVEEVTPEDLTVEVEVESTPTIRTVSGPVRGERLTDSAGKIHFQFLGIPFAQPPTGPRRFRPPLPVRPWRQTFQADIRQTSALNRFILDP